MKEIECPVCLGPMSTRIARSRRSGRPSIMLVCAKDGRHFRGFISDRDYVTRVLGRFEVMNKAEGGEQA